MGLAWRLPPEPTFEDFFLFLPRKKIDSPHSSQIATIERSERALQKSNCNTSEAHDLLNAHLTTSPKPWLTCSSSMSRCFRNIPIGCRARQRIFCPLTPRSSGTIACDLQGSSSAIGGMRLSETALDADAKTSSPFWGQLQERVLKVVAQGGQIAARILPAHQSTGMLGIGFAVLVMLVMVTSNTRAVISPFYDMSPLWVFFAVCGYTVGFTFSKSLTTNVCSSLIFPDLLFLVDVLCPHVHHAKLRCIR